MSTVDKILEEINNCRVNPAKYSQKLSKILRYFRGKIYEKPGYEVIETEEGPGNVLACINYLKSTSPVPALLYSEPLALAAQMHADDIGPAGRMSHIGEDGSEPSDRVERFCQWSGHLGENIDYGNASPEDIVVSLLIDDGVPARGQRLNLMKKEHKYTGIGFGYHSEYQYVCVIVFAELIIEPSSIAPPSVSSVRRIQKSEYVKVKEITKEETKLFESKKKAKQAELLRDLKESLNFNFRDLTEDDIIEIKEFFDKFDRDTSGTISITEIKELLRDPKLEGTNSSFLQVLAGIDPETVTSLDFEGLVSVISEKIKHQRQKTVQSRPVIENDVIVEMKEMFDLIDESGRDVISRREIQRAIEAQKLDKYNSTILDLMKYIDGQDEEITFEEFVDVISNLKVSNTIPSEISSSEVAQFPAPNPKIPRINISSYEYVARPPVKSHGFDTKKYEKLGFSREQVFEIKKAFDLFDHQKKGLVSTQDIKLAMKSQGFKKKNPTVYQIVCELGDEVTGEMDFEEFFNLLTQRNVESVEDEEIKKFFDMFDREGLGYIEIKNLKTVTKELGESLEDEDLVDLIRKSDLDGDGKVTYADFHKIMTNAF